MARWRIRLLLTSMTLLVGAACSSSEDVSGDTPDGSEDAADDPVEGAVEDGDDDVDPGPDEGGAEPARTEEPEDDQDPEPDPAPEPLDPLQGLSSEVVAEGFTEPIDVVSVPDTDRLLVVERRGTVQAVEGGQVADEPYLDLAGEVNANSLEQGLLGIAVHPDEPRLFAFHSLPNNDNVLVAYDLDGDGAVDSSSREVLLTVDKEPDKVRHNGGRLLFGPGGHLYVSLGDAARASVNGQDPTTLPGSILRIDVDGGEAYEIPVGNPFADGDGGAPEVWWYGLRNPWRFTFDEPTGLAYVADVGQEDREEINVVAADDGGLNFGWPIREGTIPFYDGEAATDLTDPIHEVRHDDTDQGCSITGGPVYRGEAIPEYDGHYFYADWCRGWIRSFRYADGEVTDEQDHSEDLDIEMVAGFGVDGAGEVLMIDSSGGAIARIVPVR